jgi:hypothetical protein
MCWRVEGSRHDNETHFSWVSWVPGRHRNFTIANKKVISRCKLLGPGRRKQEENEMF